MSNTLQLLILSDGKPGHVTSSMGVLKSLERLTPAHHTTVQVRLRIKFMRPILQFLLRRPERIDRISPKTQKRLIRFFYKLDSPELLEEKAGFDWVISAGGDTSFLNAWAARLYGWKNIYCSSLRGLNPELFTLRISLGSGPAGANEIKMTLSPAPVDRDQITEQGLQFRSEQNLREKSVWAVLIGGDGAGYHYDENAMSELAESLLVLAEKNDANLLITTSRRTGLKLEKKLKPFFDNHPSVAYACLYNHQPEKVVARFLGAADLVFCTADSGSMITEAMAAGKPVYIIKPDCVKPQPFYQTFLQQHLDAHHIKELSLRDLHTVDVNQDTEAWFQLLEKDPITELAEKIRPWIISETPCA